MKVKKGKRREAVKKGKRREAERLMSVCNPRCGELPFPPNAFYDVTEE